MTQQKAKEKITGRAPAVRLPDVLERQGLSLNLLAKLVMSLTVEKHLVVLDNS